MSNLLNILREKHKIELLMLEKEYILSENDICDILDEKDIGTYGIMNMQIDGKMDKIVKKYDNYYNEELSDNDELENYTILEMYEVTEEEIRNMKTLYITKVKNLPELRLYSMDELKLYKIKKNKIIYEQTIDNEYKRYKDMIIKNVQDNIKLKEYMLNFDNIYKLLDIKNMSKISVNELYDYKFREIYDIKTKKITDKKKYMMNIIDNFGKDIDDIYNILDNKYKIPNKLQNVIKKVIEIIARIYISIKHEIPLELNKDLLIYIKKEEIIYSKIKSKALLSRHIRTVFELEKDIEFTSTECNKHIFLFMGLLNGGMSLIEIIELL